MRRTCTRSPRSSPSATRRSSPSAPTTAIRSTSPRRAISTSSSARRSRSARRRSPPIAPRPSRRRASSVSATAASSRPAGAPISRHRRSRALRRVDGDCPPAAWWTTPCSPARASLAPVGRRSVKARRVERGGFCCARAGAVDAGDRRSFPARSSPSACRRRCRSANGVRGIDLPRTRQGRGGRAPRRQRQSRDRFRARLRHEARRDRLVGRPRQPQSSASSARMRPTWRRRSTVCARSRAGSPSARGGKVIAELALPVAGLMSLKSFEEVREALIPLRAAAKGFGVALHRAVPAGGVPAAAGDPASQDHRHGACRRRQVRLRAGLRGARSGPVKPRAGSRSQRQPPARSTPEASSCRRLEQRRQKCARR